MQSINSSGQARRHRIQADGLTRLVFPAETIRATSSAGYGCGRTISPTGTKHIGGIDFHLQGHWFSY